MELVFAVPDGICSKCRMTYFHWLMLQTHRTLKQGCWRPLLYKWCRAGSALCLSACCLDWGLDAKRWARLRVPYRPVRSEHRAGPKQDQRQRNKLYGLKHFSSQGFNQVLPHYKQSVLSTELIVWPVGKHIWKAQIPPLHLHTSTTPAFVISHD